MTRSECAAKATPASDAPGRDGRTYEAVKGILAGFDECRAEDENCIGSDEVECIVSSKSESGCGSGNGRLVRRWALLFMSAWPCPLSGWLRQRRLD